jgi:hypothetical protein
MKEKYVIAALKKPIVIGIAALLFFQMLPAMAEDAKPQPSKPRAGGVTHILGDQAFIFSLGAAIPLFFLRTSDGVVEPTNLYPGPRVSIEYMNYLSQSFAVGVEVIGGFMFSPNLNIYFTLPIIAKISYIIYIDTFQLFLNMGLGIDLEKFLEYSHVDFFVRPQAAFYLNIDPSIDLGLSVGYWLVPQFNTAGQPADQTRLGNFLDVSVSLIYHF